VQLNKNSGSDEALNPNGPIIEPEPISAEVDEMYGYEYGDEDYGAQQQDEQPEPPVAEKVKVKAAPAEKPVAVVKPAAE
jgi:hypothetical protein